RPPADGTPAALRSPQASPALPVTAGPGPTVVHSPDPVAATRALPRDGAYRSGYHQPVMAGAPDAGRARPGGAGAPAGGTNGGAGPATAAAGGPGRGGPGSGGPGP